MAKLYWKFGCMGSSKTAQALMVKFNYEQKGISVLLMKPSLSNNEFVNVTSRTGLQGKAVNITRSTNVWELFLKYRDKHSVDIVIVDEAQFLTTEQVDQLKKLSSEYCPVICYGLRTDYSGHLFEGSKRLFELASSFEEIKTVCKCGNKAEINARIENGKIVKSNQPVVVYGGDEKYQSMCWDCWTNDRL